MTLIGIFGELEVSEQRISDQGGLTKVVPYDAQGAAEEAAAEEAADECAAAGSLDAIVEGAENTADEGDDEGASDDADAPEGPGQIVGAIAFLIWITKPSRSQII